MKTVGLIGLGAMGGSYAKHLLASGYQVFGVDPDKNNRNLFSSLGGLILNNINDLTKKCKIVILSLPTVPIFKDVIKEIENNKSLLETKIAKLKNVVASARIIDESQLDTSKILIHSIIKIKNTSNKMEFSYTLVADSESDIKNGKLSVNSPIGKGLLGKELGDIVEIKVPNGMMTFEVTSVSR